MKSFNCAIIQKKLRVLRGNADEQGQLYASENIGKCTFNQLYVCAAGETNSKERIENYQRITEKMQLPRKYQGPSIDCTER